MAGIAERLEVGLPEPVSALAARDWDAVVVGGGHNGLSAAAYLAREGQSVLVLERRERLGGACTLERPFGDGYEISPCAYVVGLLDPGVVAELELERRGVKIRVADPELYIPFEDGTAFVQWLDEERTDAALREMGAPESDVQGLRSYNALFNRIRVLLREGERDAWVGECPTRAELEEMLGSDPYLIDVVFEASIADVLDEYFTDQRIKDALYIQGLIAAYGGPRQPGTALIHLMHHMSSIVDHPGSWGYVAGGMGAISLALADAAREAGAMIAAGVPAARIEPGAGVALEDGTRIRARSVLCNADPKVALRLLEGEGIPDEFSSRLREWKVRSPVLKFNAALSELPRWTAAGGETWPCLGTVDVTDGLEAAQQAFEACERGELKIAYAEIYSQTAADPSPAPEGKHLLSAFCQYAPAEPPNGDWEAALDDGARQVIEMIERFAPGFEASIEHHEVLGPPEVEAKIGLTGGNIFQGECTPDQMWEHRLSSRTPIEGFYFCGASTHPGGGVMALNGRNAAMACLDDIAVGAR
ncbi:MAG TPA: NAD(P)/FAD-dependent oxidoreductase [Solirubrobacterales bacterium]|jgi:phytoene dehydrogenase-like protein|nr:NAD(P)/FAD-dependent oxidoreductase [Solirubrobacterales bacterium]